MLVLFFKNYEQPLLLYRFASNTVETINNSGGSLTLFIHYQGRIQNFEKGGGAEYFFKFVLVCGVSGEEFLCYRLYHESMNCANQNLFYAKVKFICLPGSSGKFSFD